MCFEFGIFSAFLGSGRWDYEFFHLYRNDSAYWLDLTEIRREGEWKWTSQHANQPQLIKEGSGISRNKVER